MKSAVPYLTLEDHEKENPEDIPAPAPAACAAAVVLHKVCLHWLELVGADFVKQMRETWGSSFSLSAGFDQACWPAFVIFYIFSISTYL